MTSVGDSILLWLGAYALHSTLFLGAVWLFERLWKRATPALLSALWRTALLAGIATAALQASGVVTPVAGRFAIVPAGSEIAAPPSPVIEVSQLPAPHSLVIGAEMSQPEAATTDTFVASEPVVTTRSDFTLDWHVVGATLLWLWAGIASFLALRAAFMWWAAERELRDRQPVVQGPLFERIQSLAHDIGLRRLPQVSFSERIAGPFTLPSGEICIPVWARERLPQHQLDAMLAHEMAHVLHRDSLWLAIGMAVGTFFFFQPLNLFARRRLANLAELAADDWAATRAGSGRPLAECISAFVDIAHARVKAFATPEFAAAMAKPKSELVQRVERLLNNRYTSGVLPMKTRLTIGACALAFAAVMPGLAAQAHDQPAPPLPPLAPEAVEAQEAPWAAEAPAAPDATAAPEAPATPEIAQPPEAPESPEAPALDPAPAPQRSVSINNDSGRVRMSITTTRDDYRLTATANGLIDLAPDGSGVTGMANGGHLDATLNRGAQSRRVRYTGEGAGVRHEFWVSGQSRAWGPEADAFVAELMPIIFRETGINARERVDWLLQKRGEDALLAEIGLIDSDTIQRIYSNFYADKARLSDQRLQQLLAIVGRQMDSDTDLRLTLTGIYETQKPTGRRLAGLLRTASSMDSDTDTRLVLTSVRDAALDTDEAMAAYLDVAASIGSDTDLRLALSEVVSAANIGDTRIQQAIALAGDRIGSDTDLRLVLRQSARRVAGSDALATAYLKAARAINSSTDRRLALMALAEEAKLSPGSWRMLLDAAAGIDSSTDKRLVLSGVAGKLPRQPDIVSAYRAATETIDSKSDRRLAEQALN